MLIPPRRIIQKLLSASNCTACNATPASTFAVVVSMLAVSDAGPFRGLGRRGHPCICVLHVLFAHGHGSGSAHLRLARLQEREVHRRFFDRISELGRGKTVQSDMVNYLHVTHIWVAMAMKWNGMEEICGKQNNVVQNLASRAVHHIGRLGGTNATYKVDDGNLKLFKLKQCIN